MVWIKCTNCGHDMYSRATACAHCGQTMEENLARKKAEEMALAAELAAIPVETESQAEITPEIDESLYGLDTVDSTTVDNDLPVPDEEPVTHIYPTENDSSETLPPIIPEQVTSVVPPPIPQGMPPIPSMPPIPKNL